MGRPEGKNLTNQIFGSLTVLRKAEQDKWGNRMYLVRCQCKKEYKVRGNSLTRKTRPIKACRSCTRKKVHAKNHVSLLNRTFGSLTVIEDLGSIGKNGAWKYQVKCSCSKVYPILGSNLIKKNGIQACRACSSTIHGLSRTPEYGRTYYKEHKIEIKKRHKEYYQEHKVEAKEYREVYRATIHGVLIQKWNGMLHRINNVPSYRGIEIKFKDFVDFENHVINDLKVDPRGLHIHRINNKHYEPNNIVFVTNKQHQELHKILKQEHAIACT